MRFTAFRISVLTLSVGVLQACSTLPQREPVLPTYSTQYQTLLKPSCVLPIVV